MSDRPLFGYGKIDSSLIRPKLLRFICPTCHIEWDGPVKTCTICGRLGKEIPVKR